MDPLDDLVVVDTDAPEDKEYLEIIKKELEYVVKSADDAKQMMALIEYNSTVNKLFGWKKSDAKKFLIMRTGNANILSRLSATPHLLTHAMNDRERYVLRNVGTIKYLMKNWFSGGTLSTDIAIKEKQDVVDKMAQEYNNFIKSVTPDDVAVWADKIRDVDDLIKYSKSIMGDLYMDVLLVILQQYSMADRPIVTHNPEKGKYVKRSQTGFSLAYYGDPGTGKTFATDDLLRGNDRKGIPPHGIIGKLRYAEGMTPKQFIAILEAYQNYPVDWIIPEFRDFFRYAGMVEKLKLVMERREVSDETRTTKIGPYKVSSFFVVNYNLKLTKNGYVDTMSDPNFAAVEDRMICKLFVNTETRERLIFENDLRISNGDVEFYLADTLRKHITYTYHHTVSNGYAVIFPMDIYERLGHWLISEKKKYSPKSSFRMMERAVQIASAAALVKALSTDDGLVKVTWKEVELAKSFIIQELKSRALKSS